MQTRLAALSFALLLPMLRGAAQSPTPGTPPAAPQVAPATASSLLQPAVSALQTTLGNLKLDKWKKGSVRDEAGQHIDSILRDVQANLPPLLTAWDAAPGSPGKGIPLLKHVDALYDVLLRVEEAARVVAPAEHVASLQQTLDSLGKARLALYERIQQGADLQEKQLSDLRAQLQVRGEALARALASAEDKSCPPPARKKKRAAAAHAPQAAPSTQQKQP